MRIGQKLKALITERV